VTDPLPITAADLASLLKGAADGDGQAWKELVRRFSGMLWSVARAHRLSERDAEDVVQLTWLRLLEHLTSVRDPDRLPGWLATTCRHECLAVLRRQKRLRLADDSELDLIGPTSGSADASALTDSLHRAVWQAFSRLDERCQRVLRVLIVDVQEGRPSYAVATKVLQMPQGSLGPTRGRCLERLRQFLEDAGISGEEASS